MDLSNLRPADGAKQSDNFRRGRGHGSGNGKTAGKGHKGQKARSGATRPGFEGGQMPLYRRIPKRGFHNKWATNYLIVNLSQLASVPAGTVVDYDYVVEHSLTKVVKNNGGLKVLGKGEVKVALTVKAAKFSEAAKAAIEKAGGTAETV